MDSEFRDLHEKRLRWVDANRENGFDEGIKGLLSELYPDQAHFVFELLQNAEDALATNVCFRLFEDRVEIEHDGHRQFSILDVESITSIGKSTKRTDPTSIGKFGVGFKSVFAFTETPRVQSAKYRFEIRDLVVPYPLEAACSKSIEPRTAFVLPFNHPKKPAQTARKEIEKGLRDLPGTTLLFLKNIRRITFVLPDGYERCVERFDREGNRVEISCSGTEQIDIPQHFLRFETVVAVPENGKTPRECRIAAAFGMEPRADQDSGVTSGWRILPLLPGRVCIYFPAEKETSNLKFHLHAPFASTVARDSVRDCPENDALRNHLARLIVESLSSIRDQGLLTVDFLEVLPNAKDNLSGFYKPIREAIADAFNTTALTPMKRGGHAPAAGAYRGPAKLSEIIDDEDLAFFVGGDKTTPRWIANPPQRNQGADNFLSGLKITEWSTNSLVDAMQKRRKELPKWLGTKSVEWHRGLYEYLEGNVKTYSDEFKMLKGLKILPIGDSSYLRGDQCYFPSSDGREDSEFPTVDRSIAASDSSQDASNRIREFLKSLGVQAITNRIRLEKSVLGKYDTQSPDRIAIAEDTYASDLEVIKEALTTASYNELKELIEVLNRLWFVKAKNAKTGDTAYKMPKLTYLPTPMLQLYFAGNSDVWLADERFLKEEWDLLDLQRMPKVKCRTYDYGSPEPLYWNKDYNPMTLCSARGSHSRSYNAFDPQAHIDGLEFALTNPTPQRSEFIWNELLGRLRHLLKGVVERAKRQDFIDAKRVEEKSSACELLLRHAWIPRQGNTFARTRDCRLRDLPETWSQDKELAGILEFKEEMPDCSEGNVDHTASKEREEAKAQDFGFDTADEARQMAQILKRLKNEGCSAQEIEKRLSAGLKPAEFPNRPVADPERRKQRAAEKAASAPVKEYESREDTKRVSRDSSKTEVEAYLTALYTNDDAQLVCQICEHEMPFRKRDGNHYFEKVEAFDLPREHDANYLALCPVCSAKYKEFIVHDPDGARSALRATVQTAPESESQFPVKLDREGSLRFVPMHLLDIQAILRDAAGEGGES